MDNYHQKVMNSCYLGIVKYKSLEINHQLASFFRVFFFISLSFEPIPTTPVACVVHHLTFLFLFFCE